MGRPIAVRALLATHAFLWWLSDSEKISTAAFDVLDDESNEIVVIATYSTECSPHKPWRAILC